MQPTREQVILRLEPGLLDPRLQGFPCRLRDLKLHGALRLVLHDDRSCRRSVSMAHVADPEGDEIASAQLAVDAEVEEREFADPTIHLQADAQRPDVFYLEGGFLPDDLALVSRLALSGISCASHDGLPSS